MASSPLALALLACGASAFVPARRGSALVMLRSTVRRPVATVLPPVMNDVGYDEDDEELSPEVILEGIQDIPALRWLTGRLIGRVEHFVNTGSKNDWPLSKALSSLQEFDANFELLQPLLEAPLSRTKALSWQNVSSPAGDYAEQIEQSYVWTHEFFPGVRTRAFDPTLKMDGEQIHGVLNEEANEIFNKYGKTVQETANKVFHGSKGLRMQPAAQGIWNDEWAGETREVDNEKFTKRFARALLEEIGLPGTDWLVDILRTKPEDPHPCESDLVKRTEWLTRKYFHPHPKPADEGQWGAPSQDMSLRYLGTWEFQDEEFTDVMLSQFYMASIGQSFVHKVAADDDRAGDATYVADLDWAKAAKVRKHQGKFGGDVYFDVDGMVTHIVYDGMRLDPGDAGWEIAKRKCRSTVLMILTGFEHLLGLHLHFSNSLAMATPTLPDDHCLRRLLWPHIFNAIGINRKAAATLSLNGGIFTRGWRVTLKGVRTGYDYVKKNWDLFKFQTPRERHAGRDLGPLGDKMPLYEDGLPFFDVVRAYVGDFVDLHYESDQAVLEDEALRSFHSKLNDNLLNRDLPFLVSKDALADVLATYIYYVTGYHTHAGTAHIEAAQQGVAPSAFYENSVKDQRGAPPNSAAWATLTYIGTAALTLPITGDPRSTQWEAGFKEKQEYLWCPMPSGAPAPKDQLEVEPVGYPAAFEGFPAEIAANKKFAEGLVALQADIMARNKKRHAGDGYPPALARAYNCFDINFVECSIGI